MKKRTLMRALSCVLAIIMLLSMTSVLNISAYASSVTGTYNGFEYYKSYWLDKCTITGYTGYASNITIPTKADGYPVYAIDDEAFKNNKSIVSVTIPEGVTVIGDGAFLGCSSLERVTLPKSIINIGNNAFQACWSLEGITLPHGVTHIGDEAFRNCFDIESVTIPGSITEFGKYVFNGCSSLTSITILDGITSISDYAFSGCSALTSITIPESVTSIGDYAFEGCTSLESITIPESVTSIGGYAFKECDSLTSITIPSGVTSIGDHAFSGCSSLASITILDGVTSIDISAFSGCDGLESITIPEGVTSIGSCAFWGCSNLKSITIPSSVTSIGSSAFSGCDSLASITIPEGVKSIGSSAFYGCSSLKSITIPGSVTSFGENVFTDCGSLKSITISEGVTSIVNSAFSGCRYIESVTIPGSVTSIGDKAFRGCSSLKSITIPSSVTSIGDEAFEGCTSLESIAISDGVTSIGDKAFRFCSSLKSITIPSSVTSIGWQAFIDCFDLVSITIPSSVKIIESEAFSGCYSLESIVVDEDNSVYDSRENCNAIIETATNTLISGCKNTIIPSDITSIGDYAFEGCSFLTSITIPESVREIGIYAFYECTFLTDVYYMDGWVQWDSISIGILGNTPLTDANIHYMCEIFTVIFTDFDGSVIDIQSVEEGSSAVKPADPTRPYYVFTGWDTDFENVQSDLTITALYQSEAIDSLKYNINDNKLSITDYTGTAKVVVIPEEIKGYPVTSLWNFAFYACSSLEGITIPSSVTSIGDEAFAGCTSLTDVYYLGTQAQWNAIQIGEDNECLTNADIHFIPIGSDSTKPGTDPTEPPTTKPSENPTQATEPAQEVEIFCGVKRYTVKVGDKITYKATMKADMPLDDISIGIIFDSAVTNPVVKDTGNGIDAGTICPNLEGARVWQDYEDILQIAASGTGMTYDFTDGKLLLTYSFIVELAEDSGIELVLETIGNSANNEYYCKDEDWMFAFEYNGDGLEFTEELIVENTPDATQDTDTSDPEGEGSKTLLLGDANEDGKVNVKDATEIQKAVAGLITLPMVGKNMADVDKNGTVNVKDATAIQKYVAGIETGFPIGK